MCIGLCFVLLYGIPAFAQSAKENVGLLISNVLKDSPAERAGLVRGDILLKIEGKETNTIRDVYDSLENRRAGEKITLVIRHGDTIKDVKLTLEDRLFKPVLGLRFALQDVVRSLPGDFPEPMLKGQAIITTKGVVVVDVKKGSPADAAGIMEGDVILSVNDKKVGEESADGKELKDIISGFKNGDTVTIRVIRNRTEKDIQVKLGQGEDGKAYLGVTYRLFPPIKELRLLGKDFIDRRKDERHFRFKNIVPPQRDMLWRDAI